MTPQEAARLALERRLIRSDHGLQAWCEHALQPFGQKPASHHRLIIGELEALARGEIDRLMLFLPPGSAKSTYASKLFPAWMLAQKPGLRIIGASASSNLAESFSYDVQRFIRGNEEVLGYSLIKESVKHWITSNDGEYVAAGAGGQITGRRADLAILDDVVAGRASAESPVERENIWAWWRGDVIGRLKPGGRVILIMTRWSVDDLAGRLLKEWGDEWRVLRLPAIAEPGDLLGRKEGEALWPDWEDAAALTRKKRAVGSREWASQYQQRPVPDEGSILKSIWWKPWTDPAPSRPDMVLLSLDTAYTAKEANDYSACTVWNLITPQAVARPNQLFDPAEFRARILLRYAWQERLEFPELVDRVLDTAKHFSVARVPLRLVIEAKASGLSVIQELRRRAPSLAVWQVNPKSDKVARAHSVTSLLEGGKVSAMAKIDAETGEPVFRPWVEMAINSAAQFPMGEHDDLVDSITMALRHMRDLGAEFFSEDESLMLDYVEPKEMILY